MYVGLRDGGLCGGSGYACVYLCCLRRAYGGSLAPCFRGCAASVSCGLFATSPFRLAAAYFFLGRVLCA